MLFENRQTAGRRLAARLQACELEHPVVYALPRGGVPVAVEIAAQLHAPLDVILVRKIGAPGAPEVALAAIVEGEESQLVVNEDVRRLCRVDDDDLERWRAREARELVRRRTRCLGDRPRIDPAGRTVILVDDGLATGATMKVALLAMQRAGAARRIVAVPVAPSETLAEIARLAEDVVCLHVPEYFGGVGAYYGDFHQLDDAETVALLRGAWANA